MAELSEKQIQDTVLELLQHHPKVAFAVRVNVGTVRRGGRYLRFGKKGMSDITGMLKDGRRLEVEMKRPKELPTPEQMEWLDMVNKHKGVAFIATSCINVLEVLAKL